MVERGRIVRDEGGDERRCHNCGALVTEGAEWCGQCLTRLDAEPEVTARPRPAVLGDTPPPAASRGTSSGEPAQGRVEPFWACPVCQEENAIDLAICPVCGTSFARLFDEATEKRAVAPAVAARAGLVPGMGHVKCGKTSEGIARIAFFVGSLLVGMMFALSTDAGTVSVSLTALFALMVVFGVVESSLDAFKLASGERELITGRLLLWIFVGAFGLAVGLVVFLSIGQTPRG